MEDVFRDHSSGVFVGGGKHCDNFPLDHTHLLTFSQICAKMGLAFANPISVWMPTLNRSEKPNSLRWGA